MRRYLTILAAAGAMSANAAYAQSTPGTMNSAPQSGYGTSAPATTAPGTMNSNRNSGNVGDNQAINTDSTQSTSGGLASGANSFTEGEARRRIEASGFQNVMDLKKDDQGIWRGKASINGKQTTVGLDYRGNVVAQ